MFSRRKRTSGVHATHNLPALTPSHVMISSIPYRASTGLLNVLLHVVTACQTSLEMPWPRQNTGALNDKQTDGLFVGVGFSKRPHDLIFVISSHCST